MTKLLFNQKQTTCECVYSIFCLGDLDDLDVQRTNLTKIFWRCTCWPKMKFLGQGFQQLEHEQERQTDTHRQPWPNALPAAFAGGNYSIHTVSSGSENKNARLRQFMYVWNEKTMLIGSSVVKSENKDESKVEMMSVEDWVEFSQGGYEDMRIWRTLTFPERMHRFETKSKEKSRSRFHVDGGH